MCLEPIYELREIQIRQLHRLFQNEWWTDPHTPEEAKRFDEIITIDWLSSLSAMVKLRVQAHENVFVDHLSFVKGQQVWKIVTKVWHLEATREAGENA